MGRSKRVLPRFNLILPKPFLFAASLQAVDVIVQFVSSQIL
jgi:hypothetical protein